MSVNAGREEKRFAPASPYSPASAVRSGSATPVGFPEPHNHVLGIEEGEYPAQWGFVLRQLQRAMAEEEVRRYMDGEDLLLKDSILLSQRAVHERQEKEHERRRAEHERQRAVGSGRRKSTSANGRIGSGRRKSTSANGRIGSGRRKSTSGRRRKSCLRA